MTKAAVQKTHGASGGAGRSGAAASAPRLDRTDLLQAAGAGIAFFILYALTACRTIHTGDSPELATAAAVFGVPHPPGYPLYTLVSGIFVHVLPLANKAFEANLASSLYGALTLALAWLLMRRLGANAIGSWFGALALGLGHTFWLESTRAEVYSFDLLLFVAALTAALSAARAPGRKSLFIAGAAAGLWVGHRFVNLAYLLPLLVLVGAGVRVRRERLGPLAGGFAASLLVFLYLPLASAAHPPLDLGDPETWSRFWTVVTAQQYTRHLQSNTVTLAAARLGHYAARLPWETGAGIVAAVLGAAFLLRERKRLALGLLFLLAMNLAIASRYNILDIDDYYLPSYLAIAMLASIGVSRLVALVRSAPAAKTAAAAVTLVAILGLPLNLGANDLRHSNAAHRLAEDILASAGPNGAVFTHGDTTIHSLWYLQMVEKKAPDVVVVSLGHSRDWYFRELRARYPSDPWPEYRAGISQQATAQRVIEALSERRKIFFTMTTDPGELAAEGARSPWLLGHEFMPHGMLYEMRPRATTDYPEWSRWTAAFWTAVIPRIGRADPRADDETHSIAVEYALALTKSGEVFLRSGDKADARSLFSAIVKLDPDPVEADLLDSYHRIGWTPPLLQLGRRAGLMLSTMDAGQRR